MNYTVHGILQATILELVTFPFSRGSSNTEMEPRSPALQADSLPAEPQGKPSLQYSHCLNFERHLQVSPHIAYPGFTSIFAALSPIIFFY